MVCGADVPRTPLPHPVVAASAAATKIADAGDALRKDAKRALEADFVRNATEWNGAWNCIVLLKERLAVLRTVGRIRLQDNSSNLEEQAIKSGAL
jgi:hypothetical protein